jgi:hypothetical protein
MFSFCLDLDEKNKQMLDKIRYAHCAVALQIRMGDYVGSVLDIITPAYVYSALDYINKKVSPLEACFFVFSTDTDRCQKILGTLPYQFTYVDINDNDRGAFDMYLMKHCHHFIISNSTFGFWPALLSSRAKDKIVIQPDIWSKNDTEKLSPKYPGWVMMEC